MSFNEKREYSRYELIDFENYLTAEITDADGEAKVDQVRHVD